MIDRSPRSTPTPPPRDRARGARRLPVVALAWAGSLAIHGALAVLLAAVTAAPPPAAGRLPAWDFANGAGGGEMTVRLVDPVSGSPDPGLRAPVVHQEPEPQVTAGSSISPVERVGFDPAGSVGLPLVGETAVPPAEPVRFPGIDVLTAPAPHARRMPVPAAEPVDSVAAAAAHARSAPDVSLPPVGSSRVVVDDGGGYGGNGGASAASGGGEGPGGPAGVERGDAARGLPAPAYPRLSRLRGEEGEVVLEIHVSPRGTPGRIRVLADAGFPRLARAAVDAAKKGRFQPAGDGRAFRVRKSFRFVLRGNG